MHPHLLQASLFLRRKGNRLACYPLETLLTVYQGGDENTASVNLWALLLGTLARAGLGRDFWSIPQGSAEQSWEYALGSFSQVFKEMCMKEIIELSV